MPPALPDESDSDSQDYSTARGNAKDLDTEDKMDEGEPKNSKRLSTRNNEEKVKKEARDEEKVRKEAGDEEEDDYDEEEDVYIVEQIIEHRSDFEDGMVRYLVKWKGYEKKKDRTWEPEENLEGARDILEEYWTVIGGKPLPGQDEKYTKKRGRQSTGAAKEGATKRQRTGKGAQKSNGAVEQDVDPGPMYGHTEVEDDSPWKPPPAKDGSWDPLVQSVDTVIRDNTDGELWGYLLWKEMSEEGRFYRSKARLETIYKACPQRMLKFYEKHLVFSTGEDTATPAS